VITIDSTILGQAVGFGEKYLGGDIADSCCDRGDSDLAKILQHRIACKDKNRPFLIRR
jgi:hypothetical protein